MSIHRKGVARILLRLCSFKILFARVLLWYAYGVEVEDILSRLRKPDDRFIPSRKAAATVEAVFKVPDDAVAHLKTKPGKDGVENSIQRNDCSPIDIVADLPTNTTLQGKDAYTLSDDLGLLSEVKVEV